MPGDHPSPLIGISAYWRAVDFGAWTGYPVTLAPQGYVQGVAAAGGMPFVVPPIAELVEAPGLALDRLHGLVLAGGEDLDPGTYGAERHPATGASNEVRDEAELALLREALARELHGARDLPRRAALERRVRRGSGTGPDGGG